MYFAKIFKNEGFSNKKLYKLIFYFIFLILVIHIFLHVSKKRNFDTNLEKKRLNDSTNATIIDKNAILLKEFENITYKISEIAKMNNVSKNKEWEFNLDEMFKIANILNNKTSQTGNIINIYQFTWTWTKNMRKYVNRKHNFCPDFKVNTKKGYWNGLDSVHRHMFDIKLAKGLTDFFKAEGCKSVIDLGAGLGHYTKYLREHDIFASCFDGNPDTQIISEGRCAKVDLGLKVNFARHDWALSLEVGEHLPPNLEDIYLRNLDKANTRGAIVSWAVEGQGGDGHFNTRNNSYVIDIMQKMGYIFNKEKSTKLRSSSVLAHFENTLMVFYKKLTGNNLSTTLNPYIIL